MSGWVGVLVVGMVVLVIGVQGAIRLLVDHGNRGLVGWMPGGFGGALVADLVLVLGGAALAWLGDTRRTKAESR
ncbi:hypothetical protein AB0E69_15080 [Kribbella sp. NPDC026611]|uniref:hypothetical protein n=1 Tax=Kribbella sp. NPDC026611 TaxID=3154911 RepID=UPI0033FA7650